MRYLAFIPFITAAVTIPFPACGGALFDFSNDIAGTAIPFTDAAGGITATYSGTAAVCDVTGFGFTGLFGNALIQGFCTPGVAGPITIKFNAEISTVAFNFATPGPPTAVTVEAFANGLAIGKTVFQGTSPFQNNGEGVAILNGPFDQLSITANALLAIDNMTVVSGSNAPVTSTARPALFLQNEGSNAVAAWNTGGPNNSVIESAPWFATAAPGWNLVATADMNGDGVLDLIFQNPATGGISVWFMTGSGGLTIGTAPIIYTAAPNWALIAVADMNGDGVPDFLFQNGITNQISIWFMQAGGMAFTSAPVIATAAPGWHLCAAADINQDGVPDLIFQNQLTGHVSIWFMASGGRSYLSAPIVASPAAGWALVGTSDFDHDGTPDYVFQNRSNGDVSVWYMTGTQGTTFSSAPVIATASSGWYLLATH